MTYPTVQKHALFLQSDSQFLMRLILDLVSKKTFFRGDLKCPLIPHHNSDPVLRQAVSLFNREIVSVRVYYNMAVYNGPIQF